ncbi:hypothetical protein SDC9_54869 [bioreactor metagenome]|uniref:Uncharacterized protein n=1 Tax=bioreactor metagenome TaxID=1076179 RepID=A0A644WXC0_9ZZZZ
MLQRVVVVAGFGLLVVSKTNIANLQPRGELRHFRAVAVVAEVDVHLALIRIIQKRYGVDRLVEQFDRLVVSSDQHVHIRVPVQRYLRAFDIHPVEVALAPVEFVCAKRRGNFAAQQQNTEHQRNGAVVKRQRKESPPQ